MLVRHGETAWSLSGQHTGRTDIPLTERGEREALTLPARLARRSFTQVFTSPLARAARTCELAGFAAAAVSDPDLVEWGYGDYEGRRTVDIRRERPDWDLFRDGCPHGEPLAEVSARADRVVAKLRACPGDALVFAHRDILRIVAVRWLGLPVQTAERFLFSTAAVSVLGRDRAPHRPVIELWNDDQHVRGQAGG
ncbi:MAG: histidine phosphatase family protein [Candidatus Eisenbacteria bacterium]